VIFHVIRKEILQGFLSLRLPIMLILVTAVMISGTLLFIEDYKQQLADYHQNVHSDFQNLSKRARETWYSIYSVFYWHEQWVYRAPTRLAFVAEGREKELPNAFQVSPFFMRGPSKRLRGNYLVRKFDDLDWAFVVSVIMSFAAVVLVYDSISGERENGTLRLSMSNPVPRSTMILGKYVGTMTVLMIPLLFGMLTSMIIITMSGGIDIAGEDWIRMAVMILLSILYLSIFVMLGLFVSSLFRSSAASLVILLLAWVVIVVIIPDIGGTVVTNLSELRSRESVNRDTAVARYNSNQEYYARYPDANRPGLVWGIPLAKKIKVGDAETRIYDSYRDEMLAQVQFGHDVTRISPCAAYRRSVEAIAGSGIDHYENFVNQVRRYKSTLRQFFLDHYPVDHYRHYGGGKSMQETERNDPELIEALSSKIFTAAEIPKFRDDRIPMVDSITSSLWNIAILFAFNIFLFMAAYLCFLHQDIK